MQSMEPSQKYSAGRHSPFEQPRYVSLAHFALSSRGVGTFVSENMIETVFRMVYRNYQRSEQVEYTYHSFKEVGDFRNYEFLISVYHEQWA